MKSVTAVNKWLPESTLAGERAYVGTSWGMYSCGYQGPRVPHYRQHVELSCRDNVILYQPKRES